MASYADFMIVNADQDHFFNTFATQTRAVTEENDLEYCVSADIKKQLDFFIYAFGNEKRRPRTLILGGLPQADKYAGLRTMIHLCENVILGGPLGLIFLLFNNRKVRGQNMKQAIVDAEK